MSFSTFCRQYYAAGDFPFALDYSHMAMSDDALAALEPLLQRAYADRTALEGGAVANPDEGRMVGHYWLRNTDLIPDGKLREQVRADDAEVRRVIAAVHSGALKGSAGNFRNLLSIGIGGSALGPQFIADALGRDADDKLRPYFMDNTDPEGIARILAQLKGQLGQTLVLVISKSGGTPETRNGMLLAEKAYGDAMLKFGAHAIAITGPGSKLDQYAAANGWLARLPMYDWVGGRTSVMSAVGIVPMGLQGIDYAAVLAGARHMDELTRSNETRKNPAALLAASWYHATRGKGEKDMVVLPYSDRLLLFSRYLQQLVMESIGKQLDLNGKRVDQGIAVYGNKGSTDQHAYVQQLRDGVNNFFAVFVEVLGQRESFEVEPGITAGDYLSGFYQGTRAALSENERQNLTITIDAVTPQTVGALVALFERAVSFYASMVNINAYHQPGVEAGKKAASVVLQAQGKLLSALAAEPTASLTAEGWSAKSGVDAEAAFKILQRLAFSGRAKMKGNHPAKALFSA